MATTAAGHQRIMVGERVADRYEIEELVGAGGMSSVYKAHDALLDRHVALKILHQHYNDDEEYVERFRREARSVAKLAHPNIVTVIDRGEEGGRQFIVFEYVAGENLKQLVDRSGALPVRRAVELALEIARALAFAHDQGLVHRDVKPQNVLLNGDGEPKVTDFGIARSLDVEHGMTQTGTVLGTSNYIAPEQASGRPVDAQTDVYSLGVVLFELLTGEVPFPGDNFVTVAMKHINEPPPSLLEKRPDVPLRLAAVVDRALEKDQRDRFVSMHEFASELETVLAELGSPDDDRTAIVRSAVVRESRPRVAARRSRWPLVLSALAALAAASVLAGVLALGGADKKKTPTGGGPTPTTKVTLRAFGSYDPDGDGNEHAYAVARATDGNTATYWDTEHYRTFTKPGVGLVLDAGRNVALKRITLTSDTGDYQAQIQVGNSSAGHFAPASRWTPIDAGNTTIRLNGKSGRYYLVWVRLALTGGVAHVNEVRAG
jgi:eukaryotic-like serine/threonine-protein kinase